ncbi:porin [Burkholderia cepacia]|uniref:porin n=1 Tax=Burkholderia cepacia TaxID=292 RepID=UPI002AB74DDD|nr:porin [Burkholderia cepacia]
MKIYARYGLSLTILGIASVSHAQGSATLYGQAVNGLTYTSNAGGHSNYQVSNLLSGSRWGLLGSEDFGNGLKAIFDVESGFDLSSGKMLQNSREFGRQAFVGLSDNTFGTVTLGRQYQVSYLAPLALLSLGGGNLAVHPYDNDNLNNAFRINNSVKFESVPYRGFRFGGLYGFSNAAGKFADSRVYSASMSYASGGFTIASNYLQLNNGGSATNPGGAVATGDSTFYAGRQLTWGAGANYALGAALVGFVFTQTQLSNATAIGSSAAGTSGNLSLTNRSARFTNYELNASYRLDPAFSVGTAYTFTDARLNGASPKYHHVTVQADYALSKRTDVYAIAAFQHVSNTGSSGITADIVGVSRSSTSSQVVATIGIRHRF